jgi:hypothetical protein
MPEDLKPDQLVEAIENAFLPLECRVDLYDQARRLALNIVDINGEPVLPPYFWLASQLRKHHRLRARIISLRTRVELEGYTLEPWAFPTS